jgi:hypothetical protein
MTAKEAEKLLLQNGFIIDSQIGFFVKRNLALNPPLGQLKKFKNS